MTRMLLALAMVGCTGGQQAESPAAPPTAVEPAPGADEPAMGLTETEPRQIVAAPGEPGLVDAIGAAGGCGEAGVQQPLRVLAWSLPNDGELFAVECTAGDAPAWEWYAAWSLDHVYAPVKDAAGAPMKFAGMPDFDKRAGVVTWVQAARPDGSCGDWFQYRLADEKMTLEQHRRRACDAQGEAGAPSSWPLVPAE